MDFECLLELLPFLNPEARMDLKCAACMTIAQLTGTPEGLTLLASCPQVLKAILGMIKDSEPFTAKDAMRTLVNLSAEEEGAAALLGLEAANVVQKMLECVKDTECRHTDIACGVLANLSKRKAHCVQVWQRVCESNIKLDTLIHILCQIDYNKKGQNLHLLAPVITNFSQLPEARKEMMAKDGYIFQRLLPFMEYKESKGRRKSIIDTIHNCCFDKDVHEWLLGTDVDLAPRLALPLAGPDTFTEEENDSLPPDLQYLPDDKQREEDPVVRRVLLEALMQLCITRSGREALRNQNIYLILREHHKWEEDKQCIMLNEDIVNLLVRTEEEIGVDDLSGVEVPEELSKKFEAEDALYLAAGSSDLSTMEKPGDPNKPPV